MGLRGESIDIALSPTTAGNLSDAEKRAPVQLELRNGRLSDLGSWKRRPGHGNAVSLGANEPVVGLVPYGSGLALTADGNVVELKQTPRCLSVLPQFPSRPRWIQFDNDLLLAGGGPMITVTSAGVVSETDGSPPQATMLATLNNYVLAAGQDRNGVRYSSAGDYEAWNTLDEFFTLGHGEQNRAMQVMGNRLYIFLDRHTEIWDQTGGLSPFQRSHIIDYGTPSGDSVVFVEGRVIMLGHDRDFYTVGPDGVKSLARDYRPQLASMPKIDDCYAMLFEDEHVVSWVFPTAGRVLSYDYRRGVMLEDSKWEFGGHSLLEMNCAARINGKQLVGWRTPTGTVYERSTDFDTDAGTPIRISRSVASELSPSRKRCRVARTLFHVQRGTTTPAPILRYRHRMDTEQWGDWKELDLGSAGYDDPYIRTFDYGTGRKLSMELVETDPGDWLLMGLSVDRRELGS